VLLLLLLLLLLLVGTATHGPNHLASFVLGAVLQLLMANYFQALTALSRYFFQVGKKNVCSLKEI
jgi:hypothetical protein